MISPITFRLLRHMSSLRKNKWAVNHHASLMRLVGAANIYIYLPITQIHLAFYLFPPTVSYFVHKLSIINQS